MSPRPSRPTGLAGQKMISTRAAVVFIKPNASRFSLFARTRVIGQILMCIQTGMVAVQDKLALGCDEIDAVVRSMLTSIDPTGAFGEKLLELERAERTEFLIEVFESVCAQSNIENYWAYAIAVRAYASLGQANTAFVVACYARSMDPKGGAGYFLNFTLFHHFSITGRLREAVFVCVEHNKEFPSIPFTTEDKLLALMEKAGIPPPLALGRPDQDIDDIEVRTILPQTVREGWDCPIVLGGTLPPAIADLGHPEQRPRIDVAHLKAAKILISENQMVVVGSSGGLQRAFSVAAFPNQLLARFEDYDKEDVYYEVIHCEKVILLSDAWYSPNYCHFMLDQIGRVAIYKKALGSLDGFAFVGPPISTRWQQEIFEKLYQNKYISTGSTLKVETSELWVSSECGAPLHHAYAGSKFILEFLRQGFGVKVGLAERRIYVSRNDGLGRRIANEDIIFPILERHGFIRIFPGKMSIDEQVEAFSGATHIVGPHGANMTNIIFASPGTFFMEIFHPQYSNAAFARLCPALDINYAVLTGRDGTTGSDESQQLSSFESVGFVPAHIRSISVDPEALLQWLKLTGCSRV